MNTEATEVEDPIVETPKLELSVDVEETSACGRHVTVTVPRSEVERYFSKQFDELLPKAELPGFRTGKAPRVLIEKKFRKQLTDQVKGQLIMDSLAQVNSSEEFSAISEPDLDYEKVKIPDEGDFKYEFNIEVRPEFEVPNYKGLSLTRPEYDFTDADIDAEIERLCKSEENSIIAVIDGPAEAGDRVVCKITSRIDGDTIATIDEISLTVVKTVDFADAQIEEFDKLMIGASAGDTRTVSVELSRFADNEALRGKTVDLEIEVLDVKRVEGIDVEEVVENVGCDDVADLRKRVESALTQQLQYAQRQTIRQQISDALTESADWNLPTDLLERQAQREVQRAVMEMRSSGFSTTEIVARENLLRKNAHQRTAVLLKEHFILERIAEIEEIEDSPEDYELEIMRIARQQNISPRHVRSQFERSGQMDVLRNMIIERKVIELITSSASFKGLDYSTGNDEQKISVPKFVAGRKTNIPQAKYDGGEAPAIPGTTKDK